jgi:protein O-GlcNAc transferase
MSSNFFQRLANLAKGAGQFFQRDTQEETRSAAEDKRPVQGIEEAMPKVHGAVSAPTDADKARLIGLFNKGDYSALEREARVLTESHPDSAFVWSILGGALHMQGKDALAVLEKTAELSPDNAAAQNNLGGALKEHGRIDDAIVCFKRALAISPNLAEAHNNLGDSFRDLGRFDEALVSCRRAVEINPSFADAQYNLGNVLRDLGQLNGAIESYRKALSLNPKYSKAYGNLGNVLGDLGQDEGAMDCYRQALKIDPYSAEVHFNLGNGLKDCGQHEQALASYRKALEIRSDFVEAQGNLLFEFNFLSTQSSDVLQVEARRFGELVQRKARPFTKWRPFEPDRCLRVGFVSGDLNNHPVGYFVEGVIAALRANTEGRMELYGYPTHSRSDELTERLKSSFHKWSSAVGLSDGVLAKRIHDDGVDVLIDLSGHTAHNRLSMFAWKPAPLQATWLGYFATTGVGAIDYLIADPWTLPESEENKFTEIIWRLPETRLCFTVPNSPVQVSVLPALTNKYITFGCFNNLAKMNDAVVALWSRVLASIPDSRLLLKATQLKDEAVKLQTIKRFEAHGVRSDRILVEGPSSRSDYFAAYHKVDISLDPFPYTGGTTSVEGLWMGVPVLTLAGDSFLARQGVGLMMNSGLPEWVAENADDYVRRAVVNANNIEQLSVLRKGLREQVLASPLFDADRFAKHFEDALRGMWKRRCPPTTGA